jgi:hypothetical protein
MGESAFLRLTFRGAPGTFGSFLQFFDGGVANPGRSTAGVDNELLSRSVDASFPEPNDFRRFA